MARLVSLLIYEPPNKYRKMKVTKIAGRTRSGKKGIRYEHPLKVGDRVKYGDMGEGLISGEGIAGMPQVDFENGQSILVHPDSLEIIEANSKL